MDLASFIKNRLRELKLDQREVAVAAQVTESYVSQLLTGKKAPPAPERTDIYDKLAVLLRLPPGQLARLAELQRQGLDRHHRVNPPVPLFAELRDVILRTCDPRTAPAMRALFQQEAFGLVERLVTQTLLDVVKGVVRDELDDAHWLQRVAQLTNRSLEQARVSMLEFLETDVFNLSGEQCEAFLTPLVDSWTIDLAAFELDIVLNRGLVPGRPKRFQFVERSRPEAGEDEERGLRAFLQDPALSGTATPEEIAWLRRLTFNGRRPRALYYYRELQSLRDPLHFDAAET